MQEYLTEILECPECHNDLDWDIIEQSKGQIVSAQARCQGCSCVYGVQDGIGMFLTSKLNRIDLWKQADTGLETILSQNPDLEKMLLDPPLDTLSPVDQYFRGVILEKRGNLKAANAAYAVSSKMVYSEETTRCMHLQMDYVVNSLSDNNCPVVDLASGECTLVQRILHDLPNPVVITDFSPVVLMRNRSRFLQQDLYDRVSLVALDARRTPFKTDSIGLLTTFLGLANIQNPGNLLVELCRIVYGQFLAISSFYPEDDLDNGKVIRDSGLADMLYKSKLLKHYMDAGWSVEINNSYSVKTEASPVGVILSGAKVDLLPAYRTCLEWCVLCAKNAN